MANRCAGTKIARRKSGGYWRCTVNERAAEDRRKKTEKRRATNNRSNARRMFVGATYIGKDITSLKAEGPCSRTSTRSAMSYLHAKRQSARHSGHDRLTREGLLSQALQPCADVKRLGL
jgi:hypothetical protein